MAIRKEFKLDELYLNGFSEREVAVMDYMLLAGADDVGRCGSCFKQGNTLVIGDEPVPNILTDKCLQLLIDVGLVHDLNERSADGTIHASFGDYYLTVKGRTFSGLGGMRHYITEMNKDKEENERARAASIEEAKYAKRANSISLAAIIISTLSFVAFLFK